MTPPRDIRAFAFDIDGVFTDGSILCDLRGELFRTFDAKDGFAVRMASMKSYPLAIITGGRSGSIRARFRTCGIPDEDIYLGSRDKIEEFRDFCKRHALKPSEVLYIGDDIPDIGVMEACGIGACPGDAVAEVIEAADLVLDRPGGRGAVREAVELVMKARGDWSFDAPRYKELF